MLVSDTVLEIKVKRALETVELSDCDIRIHVQEGVVTLGGSAPSERLKLAAAELAESVFGVDEVDNRIRVA